MLRPTADVLHAQPRERFFELGLSAPHCVLAAVVGEHLRRLPIRSHAALEGLHHQRGLLMVRERVADDEAAVVVHEHAHVEPLRTPQPKREDVRLPQLVRRRALEATRTVLALSRRRRRFDHAGLVQDPPDLLLADTQRLEARHHVADAPRPPRLVLLLELEDLVADRACLQRTQTALASFAAPGLECTGTVFPELRRPLLHGCDRHPVRRCHILLRRSLQPLLNDEQLVRCRDLPAPSSCLLLLRHRVSRSADLRQRVWGARR